MLISIPLRLIKIDIFRCLRFTGYLSSFCSSFPAFGITAAVVDDDKDEYGGDGGVCFCSYSRLQR